MQHSTKILIKISAKCNLFSKRRINEKNKVENGMCQCQMFIKVIFICDFVYEFWKLRLLNTVWFPMCCILSVNSKSCKWIWNNRCGYSWRFTVQLCMVRSVQVKHIYWFSWSCKMCLSLGKKKRTLNTSVKRSAFFSYSKNSSLKRCWHSSHVRN